MVLSAVCQEILNVFVIYLAIMKGSTQDCAAECLTLELYCLSVVSG